MIQRPGLAALIVIGITSAFVPGAMKTFPPDNSLKIWFLETEPLLKNYQEFQRHFGNDEVIVMAVDLPYSLKDTKLSTEELEVFKNAATSLEAIEGIEQVISIFSVVDAFEENGSLSFKSVFEREDARDTIGDMISSAFFQDRLIDGDQQTLLWLIKLKAMDDIDVKRDAILANVREVAIKTLGTYGVPLGGVGVIYSALNVITQSDFGLFVSISYLLIFLCLFALFRDLRVVAAIATALTCANISVLGMYGYMGHRINMVTIAIPSLVFILGIIGLVHFPNAVGIARSSASDARGAIEAGMKRVFLPCLLTTLTTAIGFFSFIPAPMQIMRDFGLYTGIGLVLSFLFGIAFLSFIYQSPKVQGKLRTPQFITSILTVFQDAVQKHSRLCLAGAAIFALMCLVHAARVEVDTYTLGYLPDRDQAVTDHAEIETSWGDYMPLEFLVIPTGERRVNDPDLLNLQYKFVQTLKARDLIRSGTSLSDVYRRILEVLRSESVPGPLTSPITSQLDTLIQSQDLSWEADSPLAKQNFLRHLTNESFTIGRVTVVTEMMSAQEVKVHLAKLMEIGREIFGEHATLKPAGYVPLYVKIIDYVMEAQTQSFMLALSLIFCVMLVWLRSLRLALISLIPNLFPVLVVFGVMGALGIDLDIATATIAAIVLGVSIDDPVHFFFYWRRCEKDGLEWEKALESTYRHAGSAAVLTTLILVVGYPVLMLGSVKTVVYFGLLVTIASIAALFADLIILPALLRIGFKNVRTL
jgi:uncharacterized protein